MDRLELPKSKYQIHRQIEIKNLSAFFITLKKGEIKYATERISQRLTVQLEQYATMRQKRESAKSRLDEIFTILDGLQNHPMKYDDTLVRQIIECVVVESKEKIKVVFIGGTEIEMTL